MSPLAPLHQNNVLLTMKDGIHEIKFSNNHSAKSVLANIGARPQEIIKKLGVGLPQAVFWVCGGASFFDERDKKGLENLFCHGIVKTALDNMALIIDGGTNSGIMALNGLGAAHYEYGLPLLGVVPLGKVIFPGHEEFMMANPQPESVKQSSVDQLAYLDPNHTHFVLVNSQEWGGETATMVSLVEAYSEKSRALTILVNGGAVAKKEILCSVRARWPVIVFQGSGRLADLIVNAIQETDQDLDPDLEEIVTYGTIEVFPLHGSPQRLRRLIEQFIAP